MSQLLTAASSARLDLLSKYSRRIEVNPVLSRALVSYQSNRRRPGYRWFKYKEGFSAALVEYLLGQMKVKSGRLLDPFAGCGAALFVARDHGLDSEGIELLPVGLQVVLARLCAEDLPAGPLLATIRDIERGKWRVDPDPELAFRHLRITRDAFRPETEREIAQFRTYARDHVQDARVQQLCELACMSVLESVSFTRKDGQYLRWDSRSVRTLSGKPFDKGPILTLETAIVGRLREMAEDVSDSGLFPGSHPEHEPDFLMHEGSCLHVLPSIATDSIDVLVTSPPYCNRYDYTRTYALELAYLGVDEFRLKQLRQSLLSCTVENRSKVDELHSRYGTNGSRRRFQSALRAFEGLDALQEVLILLDAKGRNGELNNPNVPRMVRNYFLESAVAIFEWARVVRPGGRVAVVNDNVQYGGEEVPVDLILCELAERAGFRTEAIWTLERGKGNSSQQMGAHGRKELRKCVYIWRRK